MPQTARPDARPRSRLVQGLSDLTGLRTAASGASIADQLGRLIDLSDSIALARAFDALQRLPFRAGSGDTDLRDDLLQSRADMVTFIVRSFTEARDSVPFSLPLPEAETLATDGSGFAPYQRFYALHQSEMEHRIVQLRQRVRQTLGGRSAELARLAALDKALDATLAAHGRKQLAAVPRLLGARFQQLRQQHLAERAKAADSAADAPDLWLQAGGWLARFRRDLLELLLAELETRLQPVLGLIEALDTQTEPLS